MMLDTKLSTVSNKWVLSGVQSDFVKAIVTIFSASHLLYLILCNGTVLKIWVHDVWKCLSWWLDHNCTNYEGKMHDLLSPGWRLFDGFSAHLLFLSTPDAQLCWPNPHVLVRKCIFWIPILETLSTGHCSSCSEGYFLSFAAMAAS